MAPHAIWFWITLREDAPTDYSPFQGFSEGLLRRGYIVRQILSYLPPSVMELYKPSALSLAARAAGLTPYCITPIIATELVKMSVPPLSPFWVVFTDDETHSTIQDWVKTQPIPVLVLNADMLTTPPLLGREALKDFCDSVISYLNSQKSHPFLTMYNNIASCVAVPHAIDVEIDLYNHNTTVPNELIMLSAGFRPGKDLPALVGLNETYVEAICRTVDSASKLRRCLPNISLFQSSPPLIALVITTPGMLLATKNIRRPKLGSGLAEDMTRDLFSCLWILQRQKNYAMTIESSALPEFEANRMRSFVLESRVKELNAYTDAVSAYACSYIAPVIRLPPLDEIVRPNLIRLADAIRAETLRPVSKPPLSIEKLKRLAQQVFEQLASSVDAEFLKRIDCPYTHVKIVSDAPLEWLPIRGLPLLLRQSVSRTPATPGNACYRQILPRPQLRLSMADFSEVLVIRSFKEDDPVRDHLQDAIKECALDGAQKTRIRFIDVRNRIDLINAFNSFDGALVVLDCHGKHRLDDNTAVLCLTDEDVDVSDVRMQARIPPIVITCVCDTHALARNHATCATGFLECGARTVLATVLPVNSLYSVLFIARMLYRIFNLLPLIVNANPPGFIRWDRFVNMMHQMQFVTEYIMMIKARHHGKEDWEWRAQHRANALIHEEPLNWFEMTIDAISAESELPVVTIEKMRQEHLPFPETYKYLQMGQPELIVLGPETADAPSNLITETE